MKALHKNTAARVRMPTAFLFSLVARRSPQKRMPLTTGRNMQKEIVMGRKKQRVVLRTVLMRRKIWRPAEKMEIMAASDPLLLLTPRMVMKKKLLESKQVQNQRTGWKVIWRALAVQALLLMMWT